MNLSESWRNNKQDAKPKPFRLRWLISMTWRLCAVCLCVSMCVWMFNWVCGCVTVNMCFYTCLCLNPFTAIILKMTNKSANFEIIKVFSPVRMRLENVKKHSIKMHSFENRFVIRPSNTLFCRYVCVHIWAWQFQGQGQWKGYENTIFCNNASHLLAKWCPVSETVNVLV